jgi:hypothetical protein
MNNTVSSKLAFEGSPESELEIAYLLGVSQQYLPFPFVVTAINDAFPDCEGVDPTTGKRITIELEVRSRNFLDHRHPPAGCDYIICWEDNWIGHKPPPKIVSLKHLFETNDELKSRLLHMPRPTSPRGQLFALKSSKPEAYEIVTHFLDVMLADLRLRVPRLDLKEDGQKQFVIRYAPGRRLLCIWPSGHMEGPGVADMVKRYGASVAAETKAFHTLVRKIGMLESRDNAEQIVAALERLVRAIESCATKN